ncbi:MAG: hypothetical protein R3C18_07165 [Planctomycetaceae bacterium]
MHRPTVLTILSCFLCLLSSCDMGSAGSQTAAEAHFDKEFRKWMSDQESEVMTLTPNSGLQTPIGYDIRSITEDKPDPLAFDSSDELPADWNEWPAYRFNVTIEWKSEAGPPLEKVVTYRLTWNTTEKKWYLHERF